MLNEAQLNKRASVVGYSIAAKSKEDEILISGQAGAAQRGFPVVCRCGKVTHALGRYRCFACGEFFCPACAQTHFNLDLERWDEEQKLPPEQRDPSQGPRCTLTEQQQQQQPAS